MGANARGTGEIAEGRHRIGRRGHAVGIGGTHTLIQIDTHGNGTAGSEILLTGATGLTAEDFLL